MQQAVAAIPEHVNEVTTNITVKTYLDGNGKSFAADILYNGEWVGCYSSQPNFDEMTARIAKTVSGLIITGKTAHCLVF